MATDVHLRPVDGDEMLERLLAVALADAPPEQVMPPVAGPPGIWTAQRQKAFRDFHRERYDGLAGEARTVMYAILIPTNLGAGVAPADHNGADRMVGMIRMSWRDEPDAVETGIWLGRSLRGRGLGAAALRALVAEAARHGARAVVAETTVDNHAALAVLRRAGATLTPEPGSDQVRAVLPIT